jgi:hypothetical protein
VPFFLEGIQVLFDGFEELERLQSNPKCGVLLLVKSHVFCGLESNHVAVYRLSENAPSKDFAAIGNMKRW